MNVCTYVTFFRLSRPRAENPVRACYPQRHSICWSFSTTSANCLTSLEKQSRIFCPPLCLISSWSRRRHPLIDQSLPSTCSLLPHPSFQSTCRFGHHFLSISGCTSFPCRDCLFLPHSTSRFSGMDGTERHLYQFMEWW